MAPESRPAVTEPAVSSADLLQSLQQRAWNLLTEFRSYQAYLKSNNHSKDVETRIFRRGVEAETKSLDTITAKYALSQSNDPEQEEDDEVDSKRLHVLRSSNLPFYEAVWCTAKRCRGIRSLGKRLYWDEEDVSAPDSVEEAGKRSGTKTPKKQRKIALVDIVANDGCEWIKVSIVSAKRLIFEMAKEGWERYGSDSDTDQSQTEYFDAGSPAQEQRGKLELVRLAEDLKAASRATRVKYQHPQVKFILPKIIEGEEEHIDGVIADIRATGAMVVCGHAQNLNKLSSGNHPPCQYQNFERMLPSSGSPRLTSTLNIDCTILLALISDISHMSRADLPPSPANQSGTYHTAIIKQIESEEVSALLPSELFPLLSGRNLVCTSLAAQRMREIVQTMGTVNETLRAEILLAVGRYDKVSSEELRDAWQRMSSHVLPDTVRFPITVENFTFDPQLYGSHTQPGSQVQLSTAKRLKQTMNLSPINASVFIYGWMHDVVTVTSNRVVAAGIERTLNQILDEDEREGKAQAEEGEFVNPKMYVCETARSLVGKEKKNGLRP